MGLQKLTGHFGELKSLITRCLLGMMCSLMLSCAGRSLPLESSLKPGAVSEEPQIRVKISSKKILELPIETYLAGVIGHEMSPRWPLEALKAQTVAARSYALFRLRQNRAKGNSWDVLDSQADQVFRESTSKNPFLLGVVAQTRGEVLVNREEPVEAFFSSTCGGKTENPVHAGLCPRYPVQKTSKDPYCATSPFVSWTLSYPLDQIESMMNRKGYSVNGLRSVKIAKRNASGYVNTVRYIADNGSGVLPGKSFRYMIGSMTVKSLNFNLHQEEDGTVVIHGAGFGHGAGLCQYGAKEMAQRGMGYRKILGKYYPKIEIRKMYE